MRGVSEWIRQHDKSIGEFIENRSNPRDFLDFHLTQIRLLQHERLVHLLVLLAVTVLMVAAWILFLVFRQLLLFVLFVSLLGLCVFYVLHYFKLENTVIRWIFIYYENRNKP